MKHKKHIPAADKTDKIEELTNDLKRVQAEFENFKKRTDKDRMKDYEAGKADIMKKLLPIMDTFESALKTKNSRIKEEKNKGLELIYTHFMKILADQGLAEVNAKGKFNPDFHEAMLQQQSDEFEDDEIIEVMQKGYKIGDCVVRPAKVKINVRPQEYEKSDEEKPEKKKKSEEKKSEKNKNKAEEQDWMQRKNDNSKKHA